MMSHLAIKQKSNNNNHDVLYKHSNKQTQQQLMMSHLAIKQKSNNDDVLYKHSNKQTNKQTQKQQHNNNGVPFSSQTKIKQKQS